MINWLVMGGIGLLRTFHKVFGKKQYRRVSIAEDLCDDAGESNSYFSQDGLIENQHAMKHIPLGNADMAGCGCEIIAVYNALTFLGEKNLSLDELIKHFEKDGILLGGKFGTSPIALRDFFLESNIGKKYTIRYTAKIAIFDSIVGNASTAIITFFNDRRDIRKQIHTVCLTRDGDIFIAHNLHCNGWVYGPYGSIADFISSIGNHYAKGLYLIVVER